MRIIVALAALFSVVLSDLPPAAAADKPNIVIILADEK